MATRKRTRARELALQYLYGIDLKGGEDPQDADPFLRMQTGDNAVYLFATGLVNGCLAHIDHIDGEIQRVAEHWDLPRLAAVDRNILRLGAYEILFRPDIPPQVTLNEAIELAKRFSTRKSGAFVNGLLDRLRVDRGRELEQIGRLEGEEAPQPEGMTSEVLDDGNAPD